MRPRTFSYTPLDDSTTYFMTGATGVGPYTPTTLLVSDGLGHQVSLTSAANISAITLTVTGLDANGQAQTEAITGPNATTVYGTKYFSKVTSVAASATLGANTMDVGIKDVSVSPCFPLNFVQTPFSVSLFCDISGTINYTVQHCFSNPLAANAQPSTFTWMPHASIVAKTADTDGNYAYPVTATRLLINSLTSGATIAFTVIQGE